MAVSKAAMALPGEVYAPAAKDGQPKAEGELTRCARMLHKFCALIRIRQWPTRGSRGNFGALCPQALSLLSC